MLSRGKKEIRCCRQAHRHASAARVADLVRLHGVCKEQPAGRVAPRDKVLLVDSPREEDFPAVSTAAAILLRGPRRPHGAVSVEPEEHIPAPRARLHASTHRSQPSLPLFPARGLKFVLD